MLFRSKDYKTAIKYGKKAEWNIEIYNRLNHIIPDSYLQLKEYDLALKTHLKNIKRGAYVNILDSSQMELLGELWQPKMQAARKVYEKKIDYAMRKELYLMLQQDQKYRQILARSSDSTTRKMCYDSMQAIDAHNFKRIKEMMQDNGDKWIYEKVGHNEHDSIWQPDFFILHLPSEYILKKIIEAARRNKCEWSAAFLIQNDVLTRPRNGQDVRLRYIIPKHNGDLDIKRSYFGLYTLTGFLTTQRYPMLTVPQMERMSHPMQVENARKRGSWNIDTKISLYRVKFENESDKDVEKYKKGLQALKTYLVSQGVKAENIQIDNTLHTRVYDNLGKYRYAFQVIPTK